MSGSNIKKINKKILVVTFNGVIESLLHKEICCSAINVLSLKYHLLKYRLVSFMFESFIYVVSFKLFL
jgi:hypothetical protein